MTIHSFFHLFVCWFVCFLNFVVLHRGVHHNQSINLFVCFLIHSTFLSVLFIEVLFLYNLFLYLFISFIYIYSFGLSKLYMMVYLFARSLYSDFQCLFIDSFFLFVCLFILINSFLRHLHFLRCRVLWIHFISLYIHSGVLLISLLILCFIILFQFFFRERLYAPSGLKRPVC